jgi:Rrf2 family protein
MFRLSRAAEYAIRGVAHLADNKGGEVIESEKIAKAEGVPAAYLAKLFQALAKKGFVRSVRGPEGGFTLAMSPERISLLDIIEAVEGPIHLNDCLIRPGYCQREPICPVHDVWRGAQEKLLDYLKESNFADLVVSGRVKSRRARRKACGTK